MSNYKSIAFIALLLAFLSCRDEALEQSAQTLTETEIDRSNYPDWTDETHGNQVDPNYDVVFPQKEVLRLDITISDENWSLMQTDLSTLLGSTGQRPGPGQGGGVASTVDADPIWVDCSIKYNEREWYKVGIRYKGNSSLQSAYRAGNGKLSLKLDFDQFEDDYPALKNQRFYGFRQLNLNNNFDDASLMREKVGADLFRQFGLVSSQTAFCVVYLDNGSGPQYYGVYTLVEEVDDTTVKKQLGDDSGNLYKPDSNAATFALGTYNETQMEKKNNEEIADYSDVNALYETINSATRTSDNDAWKTALESIFNVDGYMKWLAANTVMQNWDTYGRMPHNYYLYNKNGVLNWIPWDNNEAFQDGKQGGALSLSLSEVADNWPLINYLIAQPKYKAAYEAYLAQFIQDVFVPSTMESKYEEYYQLLKEYAYAEEPGYTFITSDEQFDAAVATIKTHAQNRTDAVGAYLNN